MQKPRDKLQDEYYGKTHDYSKKTDLVFSKIFLPEHIPKEFSNREYLWNSVEKIEKSKNSQLARNLLFTLPRELNELANWLGIGRTKLTFLEVKKAGQS